MDDDSTMRTRALTSGGESISLVCVVRGFYRGGEDSGQVKLYQEAEVVAFSHDFPFRETSGELGKTGKSRICIWWQYESEDRMKRKGEYVWTEKRIQKSCSDAGILLRLYRCMQSSWG